MAFERRQTAAENITVTANADLRTHQHKGVKVFGTGVILATAAQESGCCYVLMNAPNSGEACQVWGPPNVAKAVAGSTISFGNFVTVGASATFLAGSFGAGSSMIVGQAFSACASGETFSLRLR